MTNLYSIKSECRSLMNTCHDTQNRVVEKMCTCNKDQCKVLRRYMCCLKTVEGLCAYVCTCACNMEHLSDHTKKEVMSRCKALKDVTEDMKKVVSKETYTYLMADKMNKQCKKCCIKCGKKSINKSHKK